MVQTILPAAATYAPSSNVTPPQSASAVVGVQVLLVLRSNGEGQVVTFNPQIVAAA
jgi:hypothetical protein